MADPKVPTIGTPTWQPGYIRDHHQDQSKYLLHVASTGLMQTVAANAMELLAVAPGDRVLEVGCGNGTFLPRLAGAVGKGGKVVGIDHATEFVEEARARMAAQGLDDCVEVHAGDAYRLPFESGTFDAAHCERVLMHLDDPTAALAEMARVVKPGGRVVAAEPDWAGIRIDHTDREALDLVYAHALRQRQADAGLTLRRRMVDAGLVDVAHRSVPIVTDHLDGLRMYGLNLESAVEALVAQKALEEVRLRAVIPVLEEFSRTGRYFSAGWFHVLGGKVA